MMGGNAYVGRNRWGECPPLRAILRLWYAGCSVG